MQLEIIKLVDGFYQLKNVFSESLLKELQGKFSGSNTWPILTETSKLANVRYQLGLSLQDTISKKIKEELAPVIDFAEKEIGITLYQNSPQLWDDTVGYENQLHFDRSPNLTVNTQVYLSNSITEEIGTHCIQYMGWYSVPYKCNHGYIMIDPINIYHGMRSPVPDRRHSLYQSFRSTETFIENW
jgi:hypothetical protein